MNPSWLEKFQREFASALRRPLETGSATFRPHSQVRESQTLGIRRSEHGDAASRLAIYNQQYWFRLFSAMQNAAPLTSRLLGLWHFNLLLQDYFLGDIPSHYDLNELGGGMDRFLSEGTREIETGRGKLARNLVQEAFTIDSAYHRVFYAPPQNPWRPSLQEAARLPHLKLVSSKAFLLLEERYPWIRLRQDVLDGIYPGEAAISLPSPLPKPQSWIIQRREEGIRAKVLGPFEGELCRLLLDHPIGEAMSRLEKNVDCDPGPKAQQVMLWLSQSLEDGLWTGVEEP